MQLLAIDYKSRYIVKLAEQSFMPVALFRTRLRSHDLVQEKNSLPQQYLKICRSPFLIAADTIIIQLTLKVRNLSHHWPVEILIRIAMNLKIHFRKINIFTILSILTHKHGIFIPILSSLQFFLSNICSFLFSSLTHFY